MASYRVQLLETYRGAQTAVVSPTTAKAVAPDEMLIKLKGATAAFEREMVERSIRSFWGAKIPIRWTSDPVGEDGEGIELELSRPKRRK